MRMQMRASEWAINGLMLMVVVGLLISAASLGVGGRELVRLGGMLCGLAVIVLALWRWGTRHEDGIATLWMLGTGAGFVLWGVLAEAAKQHEWAANMLTFLPLVILGTLLGRYRRKTRDAR